MRRAYTAAFGVAMVLVVSVQVVAGREVACKDDPEVISRCFRLHGKLFVGNGTPSVRILRLGTKRILGVSEFYKGYMPDALERRLTWDDVVYGDFLVCPFSREEPGEMQQVCIEIGARLFLERRVEGKPVLTRLPDVAGP